MSLKDRLGLDQDPVYLIDGHAFLYRFFYANPGIARSDGHPTNALFMFVRMMYGLIKSEAVAHAGFFFDGKGKTFRHELFDDYKAQRPPMPEDLAKQVEHVLRGIELFGFKVVVAEGHEADDCIASLATRFKAERPVVIVGADKDLKQCLDERVVMWDPGAKKDKITTLGEFTEQTGLAPAQWPDFQALIGDTSDNIPGIPKVGPKTAEKIMAEAPTLEDLKQQLIDGGGDYTPAMRKKLQENIDLAFTYRELTTLATDVCEDLALDDFRWTAPDPEPAAEFLREFELRTLLGELPTVLRAAGVREEAAQAAAPKTADTTSSKHNPAQGTLFDMAPAPAAEDVDIVEAASPKSLPDPEGKTVGLVPEDGDSYRIGLDGEEFRCPGPAGPLAEVLAPAARLAVPDAKALLSAGDAWTAVPEAAWFDLGLAAYLLSPEDRNYTWERLSHRVAQEILPEPVAGEGLTAAAMADELARRLAAENLDTLMRDMETPLVGVLARMERRGILIDQDAFSAFLDEVRAELETLTARIHERAGREFNLRSSQQMAEVLFTDLGLAPRGKTPGGLPSTSFDVLEKIKHEHPVVEDIQAWRKLEKMRSTYLEPLPRAAGEDGRIRTTFNQLATATGRLSSSHPNLQNIPIRGDMGLRMRACFVAPEGKRLVAADYSQVELRVLAHLSQEPALLEAFREGTDIHSRTASLLFDKDSANVSRAERSNAKTINFGLIYGMGPQKLSGELGISLNEAKEFIARYFERLPGLRDFYQSVEDDARDHGYVTTIAGRRRLLPHINTNSQQQQSLARRQAINTRVQGSAADIIKLAMLAADGDEQLAALDAKLILQVHDELLLECPADNADKAGERLAALMSGIMELSVPLAVDWGTGADWAEAH